MILQGDALETLRTIDAESVHCCVTSPPYFGLRDYGVDGQIGLEETPADYVARLVDVFREVRRVLRNDGTLWLNLGDTYGSSATYGRKDIGNVIAGAQTRTNDVGGLKKPRKAVAPKQLLGIPWRVAFALQDDGWILRQDIIWHKPNPMPESVRDRCTKSHEYVFLLAKSGRYYFDQDAIKEPAIRAGTIPGGNKKVDASRKGADRNLSTDRVAERRTKRDVWTVATKPYKGAHFACFPPALIEPCILAGCPVGGVVLDPFFGSGTTGAVAVQHGREYLGIELNADYIKLAEERIAHARAVQLREDGPPADAEVAPGRQ